MITKSEREWIENQLKANALTGQAAQKFTSESIDYFSRLRKQPRKQDFAKWDFEQAIPGIGDYLNSKKEGGSNENHIKPMERETTLRSKRH